MGLVLVVDLSGFASHGFGADIGFFGTDLLRMVCGRLVHFFVN
jgi:hypothetical protein